MSLNLYESVNLKKVIVWLRRVVWKILIQTILSFVLSRKIINIKFVISLEWRCSWKIEKIDVVNEIRWKDSEKHMDIGKEAKYETVLEYLHVNLIFWNNEWEMLNDTNCSPTQNNLVPPLISLKNLK